VITYVTDHSEGETDILTEFRHCTLSIRDCRGAEILSMCAPQDGWTHELLCRIQPQDHNDVAEAYLGTQWIGSTEV